MEPGEISLLLLILGGVFLFCELFLPSFGLMGFMGLLFIALGFFTGSNDAVYQAILLHWDWLLVLALTALFIAFSLGYITLRTNRMKPQTGREDLVAKPASVLEWSGQNGKVSVDGEIWIAYADDAHDFQAGAPVYIAQVNDLKLRVIPKN
jgi:membrane-bound serine protease (ClpP class)